MSTAGLICLGLALAAPAAAVQGVAQEVPPGHTEVCALRASFPSSTARRDGDGPRSWARLKYARREYDSPKIAGRFEPEWGKEGCFTFPTLVYDDGRKPELTVELWDDRTASIDVFGIAGTDAMLGNATVDADKTMAETTVEAKSDDYKGITVDLQITVSPEVGAPAPQGRPPSTFKTLTSTTAFFIYTGGALLAILVIVCCFYGRNGGDDGDRFVEKADAAPGAAQPRQPGPATWSEAGPSGLGKSSSRGSRPNLTIEVVTPPAARELTVVPVGRLHSKN